MATIDADDLAEAFAEDIGGSPSPVPVPVPPPSSPPSASSYSNIMKNVVRFLLAVSKSQGNDPTKSEFGAVWAQTPLPNTVAELTSALQRVYAIPSKQLSTVFASIPDEQRQYFHSQCIQLSEAVKEDMPDLSLAAALLRWVMQGGLPALSAFPEDATLGTSAIVKKNYAAVDYTCRVARPDDSNPEIQKLVTQVKQMQEQAKRRSTETPTPACPPAGASKTVVVVLAVLLALAVIGLIVLGVMYSNNRKGSVVRAPALSAQPQIRQSPLDLSIALGGGSGGEAWGFPDLV